MRNYTSKCLQYILATTGSAVELHLFTAQETLTKVQVGLARCPHPMHQATSPQCGPASHLEAGEAPFSSVLTVTVLS